MTTKIALTNIADTALATLTGPKITTIVYPGDDTATDIAGGQTINLTGAGFQSGCSVLVASTASSVVSFINSTQISFVAPALSAGTYVIYVINPDGGTAISIPGISYSGTPNWTTAAGTLGTAYETGSISATLAATGDAPVTYALATGTLPPGSTLNSNGTLSGTAQATASATTYSFTIKASDAQNQDTNRAFSITINPDVVTFTTPAVSTTYNVSKDAAIANVAMSATSAAGGSITYTADTLPTGLSISGANIVGTPTVVASTTTVLTATSTSTRSATRTINWVVSIANDTFWKNTTLLLNGETSVTPFTNDASLNNMQLTIAGDTKPNKFSPYYGDGYYSNYFDGSGDNVTTPSNTAFAFGTGDFTMECWIYPIATVTAMRLFEMVGGDNIDLNVTSTGTINYYNGSISTTSAAGLVNINNWYHIALVRSSGTAKVYVNGVLAVTQATTPNTTTARLLTIGGVTNNLFVGYISNVHVVKGTAVYTAAFTPSTTPLTAITNTVLLTCQSNRFIDKSTNNFTITKNGDTTVSPAIPFTPNSSYSTYGSGYFDGTGDYLTVPVSAGLQFGTGNFTVECWSYLTALGNYNGLVDTRTLGGDGFNIAIFANGTIEAGIAGSQGSSYITATGYIINRWNHIAFTRSGNTVSLFLNGVLLTSGINSRDVQANTGYIGKTFDNWHCTGYVSDVRLTKGTALYTANFTPPTQPLTPVANTQLLALQYNGGANNYGIIDNSNFNNIITRFGNTTQGSFSPYSQTGWSNYFDGTGDYLTVPNNAAFDFGSGNFTAEAYIYRTISGSLDSILQYGRGSITNYDGISFALYISSSNFLSFEMSNGISSTYLTLTSNVAYSANTWTHVALVRSGNNFTLYQNGVSVATGSTSQSFYIPSSSLFWVARNHDAGTGDFAGYISNVRVVKGTAVYTTTFTPPTTPLTAVSGTSLLTCQSNRLIDNSPVNAVITKYGDTSVQAYSPFGSVTSVPTSYSNYFDGSGDYFTAPTNTALGMGSGDFTVEFWMYQTALSSYKQILDVVDGNSAGRLILWVDSGGTLYNLGQNGNARNSTAGGAIVINTWTHVALVRSSGVTKFYINGTQSGTNYTDSTNYTCTTGLVYVGINSDGSTYPYLGYLSNWRMVKGQALYTTTFTPSTTPLTTTSQGATANQVSLLTCQSTTIKDNSTNNFAITAFGNTQPYAYNPFGTTTTTNVSYTPAVNGGSMYFDGTGDYLTLPSSPNFAFGTSDFSIEFWTYPTVNARQDWLDFTDGTNRMLIYYDGTNIVYYILPTAAGAITGSAPKFNSWNHIAISRISGSTRMFINGVQSGTTYTDSKSYPIVNLTIGKDNAGSTHITGYMSDIRIIKGTGLYPSNFYPGTAPATSTNNTTLLLNGTSGGIIDQHSSNVLETVGNAQLSTSVKKYNNASMYFDGTGDWLQIPKNPSLYIGVGDFTIESWFYMSSLPASNANMAIVGQWNLNDLQYLVYIRNNAGTMQLVFGYSTDGVTGTGTKAYNASFTAGVWYHVAVTRSGNNFYMFVNGTIINPSDTLSVTLFNAVGPFAVGRSGDNANYLNGYIDDLRITKGFARYTSNFTAPTAPLITK